MNTQADKSQDNKSKASPNSVPEKKNTSESAFQFEDNRPEAIAQRKMREMADNSPQARKNAQLQVIANSSSLIPIQKQEIEGEPELKEEEPLQPRRETIQKAADEEEPPKGTVQQNSDIVQKNKETTPNETGLPDTLKSGIENLSGHSLDDVKVHYNSDKPSQLKAHAYAQGTDIHVAPGQEKHLPHEAWHVVQQKQGRVTPTMQLHGKVNVNDDKGLEKEADVMGDKALKTPISSNDELDAAEAEVINPIQQLSSLIPISNRNSSEVAQREGEQELVMAEPVDATQDPDFSEERKLAAQAEAHLLKRAVFAQESIEMLLSLMGDVEIRGGAAVRALNNMRSGVAELNAEISNEAELGIIAAITIYNASDQEIEAKLVSHAAQIGLSDESITALSKELIIYCGRAAHIAVDAGASQLAADIMAEADSLNTEFDPTTLTTIINAAGQVRARKRDAAGTVLDVADWTNNVGGVAAGVGGLVEAFGVAGASGGAFVGTLGGVLGIVFGAIGVLAGLYGLITGKFRKERLKKISPAIQDDEMNEVLDYAKTQTDKATGRSKWVIGAGVAAIAAGTMGLVALSVATLGVAAAVAGIAAALIGLGFVAFRYFHKKSKRKKERHDFAEAMVAEIVANGPHKFDHIAQITGMGLNPQDALTSNATRTKLVDKLSDKVGGLIKSKRQAVAEQILNNLMNGTPSQVFEAEVILEALKRSPDKVRKGIKDDDVATEVSRVMGKLASW